MIINFSTKSMQIIRLWIAAIMDKAKTVSQSSFEMINRA